LSKVPFGLCAFALSLSFCCFKRQDRFGTLVICVFCSRVHVTLRFQNCHFLTVCYGLCESSYFDRFLGILQVIVCITHLCIWSSCPCLFLAFWPAILAQSWTCISCLGFGFHVRGLITHDYTLLACVTVLAMLCVKIGLCTVTCFMNRLSFSHYFMYIVFVFECVYFPRLGR